MAEYEMKMAKEEAEQYEAHMRAQMEMSVKMHKEAVKAKQDMFRE